MSSYYEKILATGEVKCIDEEIPFEIPKGWEWCRFSSLYLSLTDGTHSTPKYTLTGIPFISVKDISSGIIDFSNTKYISKEEHQKLSDRCHPQKGDLLLSKVGTTGIPALVTTDKEFSLFVSVALIKLTQNKFSNEFLVFMIQSPLVQEQAKENTRGVGNKNWVLSAVSKTLMVVPPLEEQERIKNRLNLVLPYIERYSSSQDKLDLLNINIVTYLKKSILQEAIKGKLVPQIAEEGTAQELLEQIKTEKQKLVKEGKLKKSALNDSVIFRGDDNRYYEKIGKKCVDITEQIPFDLPDSWSWARGKSVFMPMESTKPSSDFVYIDVDAVNNRLNIIDKPKKVRIENAPSRATRKLHKNDLLFSMVRPYLKNIALVDDIYKDAIASTGFYVITPSLGYYPMFLYYLMLSNYVVDGLNSFMKGDNSPSINNCHIENYLYPLPPIEEQQRIVEKIEQLMQLLK